MRSAGSPTPSAAGEPTWLDVEPPSGSGWAAVRRLARRSGASWKIWVTAALAVSTLTTIQRARQPPMYTVDIVLRVLESTVPDTGSDFGVAALNGYVNDLVFTNANLLAVMKRHPETFRGLDKNPTFELEDFRKLIGVAVSENDFVQERDPNDPPRNARIVISYTAAQPELALTLAQELVELVIGASVARQREDLARERTATESAVRRAEAELARTGGARGATPGRGVDRRKEAARWRLQAAGYEANAVRLAERAAALRQGLRFEVVDPGRAPTLASSGRLVSGFFATLAVALMVGWLLAGALDPRVLDAGDLELVGLAPLGRLPAPPRARPVHRAPSEVRAAAESVLESDPGQKPEKEGETDPGGAREITRPRV